MIATSQEGTLVHDFGLCSPLMLSTESPVQHTLHDTQDTKICFAVSVDGAQLYAQVTFTPFHRPRCSFTYHDYEVRCSQPPEVASPRSQSSIIAISQLLYDRHFLQNAGYRFRFLKQDLQVPDARERKRKQQEQSEIVSEAAGNLVWVPQEPHFTTLKKDSSSKRSKQASTKVTIDAIRGAYEDAHRQGTLHSSWVPQLQRNASSMTRWDPYIIPANRLSDALLNEDKLECLRSDLQKVTRRVPSAAKWIARTQAKSLTSMDIHTILQTAFAIVADQPRRLLDIDVSPILAIGLKFLDNADHLYAQTRISPRGVLVARLIGFSVMRVYEALATENNEKVDEHMQRYYPGAESWQKKSRSLACHWSWMMSRLPGWKGREVALYLLLTEEGGENTLRNLFKRSLPAAVGELTTILDCQKYFLEASDSMRMPSIIEIVKDLLSDHVPDRDLCRALGCPDTYLEGSATQWLEKLRTSQDSAMASEVLTEPSTSGSLLGGLRPQEKGRATDVALAATAHEGIYIAEDILQDLDQQYAFNLCTAHDLDSLENDFLLSF